MSRDITPLYPFTVRLENGLEYAKYVPRAEDAARLAELQSMHERGERSPVVLVIRADEPFLRKRSTLRRLLDWWES